MATREPPTPQGRPSRIFVVEDHPIVCEGLRDLINREGDLAVCGEAASTTEALEAIRALQPDLAIVDISLGHRSGLDLIKDIAVRFSDVRVLVLSMHDVPLYAERALRAGACGYVMKKEANHVLLRAIRRVLEGGIYISEKMEARVVREFVRGEPHATASAVELLSDRELQVFQLIGQRLGTRRIAEALHISTNTVESHRANIKEKLALKDGNELILYAVRWRQEAGMS